MYSGKKRIIIPLASILLSIFLIISIGEAVLRLTNIPGIDKNTHYTIDPLIDYGDIPHGKLFYCNNKGDIVRRKFNSFGYLDTEHKKEKIKDIFWIQKNRIRGRAGRNLFV